MRRTVCSIASWKDLLASAKSRCASSKKKTSLGLSMSPTSGRSWKRSASIHMRKVEKSAGRSCTPGSSRQVTRPLPSGARRMQVGGVEGRLTEERIGALVLEGDELAQDDAGRRGREATERLELGLALVTHEVGDDGAQVLEVEEREAVLVGVVEDEPEARLLGVVEAEDLGEQGRTEVGDRRADRNALALPAERQELRRVCRGLPVLPDVLGSRAVRSLASPGLAMPDRSPLMSARKTGTP